MSIIEIHHKIMGVTGHRSNKVHWNGRSAYNKQVYDRLVRLAEAALKFYEPEMVYTGMALGFDQACAQACKNLEINYTAVIPHSDQSKLWPEHSRLYYDYLVSNATNQLTLATGPFHVHHMTDRNQYLVDHSQTFLALWDGSNGGTADCVRRATKKNIPIYNVWDKWIKNNYTGDTK